MTSTDSIEDFVRTHEESISFVDYREQLEEAKGIKILAVEKSKPGKTSFRSSQSREYPLVNSLHFYFRPKNRAKLSEFLYFVASRESRAIVERTLLASRSPVEFPRSRISSYTNIPIPEVSGVAWRPGTTKGQTEIVAIGDQKYDVAIGLWNSQLGSVEFKKHDVGSLFGINKGQDSEWEAVAADGKRRLFLMTEAGTVTVLDAKLEKVLQTIKLLAPDIKSTHANSGGEGFILSRNGRIFVAKEKRPLRMIEYGPKGAKPLGLRTKDIVTPFVEFPLSNNTQVEYMALKSWKLSSSEGFELADICEATSSHSGELYLLSQIDHRIVRIVLPLKPTDLEFRVTNAWWIPLGGAEGMVIASDRRPLVAIDDKSLHNNLYQLEPLLNESQQ